MITGKAQRFSTGLQDRSDWAPTAAFIGLPQKPVNQNSTPPVGNEVVCPWLRSDAFQISHTELAAIGNGTSSATLSVASIGWHEAHLNGVKLEEASVLIPSVSDLHHRVLSHQYVVDANVLVAGANVLAFWMAPGWSQLTWPDKSSKYPGREWPGVSFNVTRAPLVMAEMRVCATACQACDCSFPVTTNGATGWKAKASSIEHTGSWQWGNYGGELLDHRLDTVAWSTTAPTADWATAVEFDVDKRVTPESLEAMQAVETLPASGVAPCANPAAGQHSCFVVSLPRLINGFFEATELPGLKAGETATLTYSANCLSPCPTHPRPYTPCAPPTSGAGTCDSAPTEWHAVDTVVAGSSSSGFANKFNWHTYQYVIIGSNSSTMSLGAADLGKLQGKRITNAQTKLGSFSSSSPLLDKVNEAFVQTYEGLTVSGMQVDCTNRERLGYGGDAHSRMEFAMDSYSSSALYTKWLTDWRDTQLEGPIDNTETPAFVYGDVPNTAPTYSGAGGPMWGGITVLLPYELYRRNGDKRMLESAYPAAQGFLNFMLHFMEGGLIVPAGFDWLGDWQSPHGCDDGNDPDLYNNAYIVYALKRGAELVAAIDNSAVAPAADAAKYTAAAASLGAAVHAAFYNTTLQRYASSNGNARQGHQVMPLVAGLVPTQLVPVVMAALADELTNPTLLAKAHIDTGLTTTYFMGKLLSGGMQRIAGAESDRADLLYAATLNPTWPSFGALVTAGLTTYPETWAIGSVAGGASKMHGTLNGFGLTFPQAYLGVQRPFGEITMLAIRPSFFLNSTFPPPPPPTMPPSGPPCLGSIVGECGSATTGTCSADRMLHITCKSGTIKGIEFAAWGTPTGTCATGFKAAASCNDTRAYAVAVKACVGKSECSIAPTAFADGCTLTKDGSGKTLVGCPTVPCPPCGLPALPCRTPAAEGCCPLCPFAGQDPCLGQSKSLAVKAFGCEPATPPPPPPPPPPPSIGALTAASGAVNYVHGPVLVSWRDAGTGAVSLNVTLPIGAVNVSVWVVGKSASVTESGKPAATAEGVRFRREATRRGEAYSVWEVASGSYAFSSHRETYADAQQPPHRQG